MTINRRVLSIGGTLIGLTLFAAILSLVIASIGSSPVAAQTDDTKRHVAVSGHGRVSIDPDTGIVNLGVEVSGPELDTVQADAAQRMEAVIAAMQDAGIAEDDITTSNYNVWADRNYDEPAQTDDAPDQSIRAYFVTHTITAKVRDIDQVGAIIETGINAGANTVQGVHFTIEDPGNAVSEARELAVADARTKAEDLARITGVTLGDVISIEEVSYTPYPTARAESGSVAQDAAAVAPPINPGSSVISVQVEVSWEIN